MTWYVPAMSRKTTGVARSIETLSTAWHCAAISPSEGVGVAVAQTPSCGERACSSCAVVLWDDMGALCGELRVLGLAVVEVLPSIPGSLTRYLIGEAPESQWDEDGMLLPPWSPDSLPVYSDGAQRIYGHPALPVLWEALAELVAELDSLEAEGRG